MALLFLFGKLTTVVFQTQFVEAKMMISRYGLAALLMLAGTSSATLADPSMECSLKSSSQVETRECLSEVAKTVEAAMDAALGYARNAGADLDKTTGREAVVPALETAQTAWLDYRDKHCDFVGATFGGGSGTGIAMLSCRVELMRSRTDELMKFAQ
jgi:uncharacterized protein YecT (DUF1311 family)